MTNLDLAYQRLYSQGITHHPYATPGAVVGWMGAVQAQDYSGALWGVGLRLPQATEATIEQALADKAIVRTWLLRGTLHFVAGADLRWLVALLGPRLRAVLMKVSGYNGLDLDEATFARSNTVLATVLADGQPRTRAELATALEQAGLPIGSPRLMFLLERAQADGLICQGLRQGKQYTFVLLDAWVPPAPPRDRADALAELARRYFTSHGPATLQDFVWWSGLPRAEAQAGVEGARSRLVAEVVGQQTYWRDSSAPAVPEPPPMAVLLPPYDEYTVAYKDRSAILDPAYARQVHSAILGSSVAINGQMVGTWTRTVGKEAVVIALQPFAPLSDSDREVIATAAVQYGAFLNRPVVVAGAGG